MSKKSIVLIGGPPTAGKSELARQLAARLCLPWISSDQIRNTMRLTARREDYPDLFNPSGFDDAEQFFSHFSAKQIAAIEIGQAKAAWLGIRHFIEYDYTWTDGFILEGVNVLPSLVAQDFRNDPRVKAVFIVDRDETRLRRVIFERGLWGDADTYSDELKEHEVRWVQLFSSHIEREAAEHRYPVVEVNKDDQDTANVLQAIEQR